MFAGEPVPERGPSERVKVPQNTTGEEQGKHGS